MNLGGHARENEGMPNGGPLLFALVFAAWAAGLVVMTHGVEPFPALAQPGFGYRADAGNVVQVTENEYWVVLDNGRRLRFDEKRLLADSGAKAQFIASRLPRAASDPNGAQWLRGRLARLGLEGVAALEVKSYTIDVDPTTGTRGQPVFVGEATTKLVGNS